MNRPFEPLSPEERALAERLSRLDAHREPAPALDAAILAAARAAVRSEKTVEPLAAAAAMPAPRTAASAPTDDRTETGATAENAAASASPSASTVVPMRPRKPMSRWPLGLSLAASLVLAAGIGWRLADGGGSEAGIEAAAEKSMSDQSFASADASAPEEVTQAVILEPELNRTPPPPPPPLASADAQRRDVALSAPAEAYERKIAPKGEERARFEMDEAVAHEAAADASAFPAEPVAQSAPSGGAAASVGYTAAKPERANAAEGLAAGRMQDDRETAKSDRGEALDKIQTLGTRNAARAAPAAPAAAAPAPPPPVASTVADQPYDDQPPVSADSPQFRQAWLQRIRNLLAKGETEAGRNSLQEFRRRYPDSELPEDLKKVAATLPPPTP